MANEIGREIPEEPEKDANPQFTAVKNWLMQPQNMMTMMVLGASMMQDRRMGQSKIDAFGERAIGTLGFRGELQRRDAEDTFKNQEAEWRKAFQQGQLDAQNRQIDVSKEQVAATRENTAQDAATAQMVAGLQAGVAGMNDATERWKALLDADMRRAMMGLELKMGQLKQGDMGLEMSDKDFVDLLGASAAMGEFGTPVPVDSLLVMRNRMKISTRPDLQKAVGYRVFKKDGRDFVDVDPKYRAMFGIPNEGPVPSPTATPGARPSTPPAKKPAHKRPPIVDMSKIPGFLKGEAYKGTPYDQGTPTPQTMTFEEYLRKQ